MLLTNFLAGNIARYRKANGLTQEELGNKLGVTFQAVSKWETEQSNPDITILPQLAKILQISVDKLLGYDASQNNTAHFDYDIPYSKEEYYGGVNPSSECLRVVSLLSPDKHLKVLEIACGEGKNAVFFARCGYEVDAIDLSSTGVEKTKRLAEKARVYVNAFKADIWDYRLEQNYDIIFSSGAFHYIKPELRNEIIQNYREHTNVNGINAFNVYVEKPFVNNYPKFVQHSYLWRSGMLLTYYYDWLIEDFTEYIADHQPEHKYQVTVNQIYARKK